MQKLLRSKGGCLDKVFAAFRMCEAASRLKFCWCCIVYWPTEIKLHISRGDLDSIKTLYSNGVDFLTTYRDGRTVSLFLHSKCFL